VCDCRLTEVAKKGWVWWFTPIIPAIPKEKAGGLRSKASPSKIQRPYLKNPLKSKGLGAVA
jgi:hypothetical protein